MRFSATEIEKYVVGVLSERLRDQNWLDENISQGRGHMRCTGMREDLPAKSIVSSRGTLT